MSQLDQALLWLDEGVGIGENEFVPKSVQSCSVHFASLEEFWFWRLLFEANF